MGNEVSTRLVGPNGVYVHPREMKKIKTYLSQLRPPGQKLSDEQKQRWQMNIAQLRRIFRVYMRQISEKVPARACRPRRRSRPAPRWFAARPSRPSVASPADPPRSGAVP